MLCTSLQHAGDEYVARLRTITDFRGMATAIAHAPLGQPPANRRYRAPGDVELDGPLRPTPGSPMHGTSSALLEVVRADEQQLAAQLDRHVFRQAARALFPHTVVVEAADAERGLSITTRSAGRSSRSPSAGTRM
jgi:hypothetical protein